jgi:alanyl-tRNA synthetase
MKQQDVRRTFLDFFAQHNHTIVPSAPVVPAKDPTLLFTNAGMNQFKDIFLGQGSRSYNRAADTQKCIRVTGKHNDLEDVGVDTRHHTFFEMLGNWSFGDYYKREAIRWAWQLLADVWKIPADSLCASVFESDDEAEQLWLEETGLPASRIYRLDAKENFWEMGDTGPCGPCSEIHFDRGADFAGVPDSNPGNDDARFLEIWNLVFMQYNRKPDGELEPLPKCHVDTGMGFERITALLQRKDSNYDTDVFQPIIQHVEELSGKAYNNGDEEVDKAIRVLADHARALTVAISDGVMPSNEGRGYVLRRILRRAVRYGRNLGFNEPFLYTLSAKVVDTLGQAFPDIQERCEYTSKIIKGEEESFGTTIDRGIDLFEKAAAQLTEKVFPGDVAFRLYDTYGFPLDLTEVMARERGLAVDLDVFNSEMDAQRTRSSQSRKVHVQSATSKVGVKRKVRFDRKHPSLETTILKLEEDDGTALEHAPTGTQVRVYLPKTPFYAESGGQMGDAGVIESADGRTAFSVQDTQKVGEHGVVHIGEVMQGTLEHGQPVVVTIDAEQRQRIARHHTATHLLHQALREVLGDHVQQAGSSVRTENFRFDFNHFQKVTDTEIQQVEDIVNARILADLKVAAKDNVPQQDAIDAGFAALFGEKYGEKVRTVNIDDWSRELCGGTHVTRTGEIGLFQITGESSIAAGVRRIEAIAGDRVIARLRGHEQLLKDSRQLLHADEASLIERIQALMDHNKQLEAELQQHQAAEGASAYEQILQAPQDVSAGDTKVPVYAGRVTADSSDALAAYGDRFRKEQASGVAVFGTELQSKVLLVCVVTDNLIQQPGLKAGVIVKSVAKLVGGGGGGRPHMATAGGRDPGKLDDALGAVARIVTELLGGLS